MADQIRMSTEQMRIRSKEYDTEANKVADVIRAMDSLLKNLESEWEGDAKASFVARFTELRPGFVKAEDLIREISVYLKSAADRTEELDRGLSIK